MKNATVVLLVVLAVAITGCGQWTGRQAALADVLKVEPGQVTEISILVPFLSEEPKYTTDKQEIARLIDYFDQVDYKRMRGDVSSYMPMKASIIYFKQDSEVDFIIPYGKEAMIGRRVYQIRNGALDNAFLSAYYQSLK